ncbi:hypothetical protein CLIB1423_09S03554 [[Candida] railenensis]|uniref:Uncharacterized protein n=1 Tax=[Candida] railenensis TaxID=45579 RepID=A0A9P0VYP5_9ASCO|nr:hypothetical protein CLIB1423_09S03554 [[Candida] railenensis]
MQFIYITYFTALFVFALGLNSTTSGFQNSTSLNLTNPSTTQYYNTSTFSSPTVLISTGGVYNNYSSFGNVTSHTTTSHHSTTKGEVSTATGSDSESESQGTTSTEVVTGSTSQSSSNIGTTLSYASGLLVIVAAYLL